MPKRKNPEEKIEYYQQKIRRLERKKFRRIRCLSTSDSETESNPNNKVDPVRPTIDLDLPHTSAANEFAPSEDLSNVVTDIVPEVVPEPSTAEKSLPTSADLDPSIMAALGEVIDDGPEFGEKIHESLAKIWTPLLKKGMIKEQRESLLKSYLIPENCSLLQSPTLNPEILAAITESAKFRDKKISTAQQQLGIGVTAISRGLNLLLGSNENKVEAIKFINDGCRILSDLHHQNTETRVKFITPGLEKAFLQCIEKTERDNKLFGNDLGEKIKTSQAIVKQGQQIKKVSSVPRPSTSAAPGVASATTRTSFQSGNGAGPSRYQANRGGRGGYKKTTQRPPQPVHQPPRLNPRPRAPTRR